MVYIRFFFNCKIYEDCYHELLNELEESAEMFIKDVLEWIKKRLQP